MKMKKGTIVLIVLIIWAVFAVAYIAVDSWQDFKVRYANNALLQGREEGANQAFMSMGQALAKQVEDGCKNALPLSLGKDAEGKEITIGIVNAACLQQPEGEAVAEEAPKTE